MPYYGVKERVSEFDRQHGAFVRLDDFILFEDGAMREIHPLGMLQEPPKDPYQRHRLVVKYHQRKLQLAIEEFDLMKGNYVVHAKTSLRQKYCSPPPAETQSAVTQLKALKEKVILCKKNLKKAEAEFENNRPARQVELEKMNNQHREENSAFLLALKEIEI